MSVQTRNKPREADFFNVCITCLHSGCCADTRPPLTQKRRLIIENFLKENSIALDAPFRRAKYAYPRGTPEGKCIFFDKTTRKCVIHPVKPETCVGGPFTFDINRKTRKIEWFLKKETICPLAGKLLADQEACKTHFRSAKRELRRLVRNLNPEELRAVVAVDEPETFKIGEDDLTPSVLNKLKRST